MTAPKRRWLQFSLRTLFVVTTILSLLALLLVQSLRIKQLQNQLETIRAQNEAVRFLSEPGRLAGHDL
jgi:hypothetical protein